MEQYQCSRCGYIYTPERGRPRENIAEETPFNDLPSDWVCPFCGVSKNYFYLRENSNQ